LNASGNFRLRALLAQNLGNALLKLNQVTESEKYLRQSLALWQQLDDDLMLANKVVVLLFRISSGQALRLYTYRDGAVQSATFRLES
jgi:hypothetical protein